MLWSRARVGLLALLCLAAAQVPAAASGAKKKPNVVILFADDLGYGDLGCYGHPTIRTPNLDKMAAEGMKFTQFYSTSPVCTPSRAALLTGRLPKRSGMNNVLFPQSEGGIPAGEVLLSEALRSAGYRTACIGKWHLGHLPQYLPTNNGFDFYYGIPYSNDMTIDPKSAKFARDCVFREGMTEEQARTAKPKGHWVPLMRGDKIIEYPADQRTLTERYTEEAVKFIEQSVKEHPDDPFFFYLPYTMPHIPLFASEKFQGQSARGLYGDVVQTIDWSVGEILRTLQAQGIDEDTLVVFTSDNGPWLIMGLNGGSAGLLREGKGTTWEGGMREPCLMRWPGKIRPGQVTLELACTMDLFTTCLALAGAELPRGRVIDGVDLSPLLFGTAPGPRQIVYYYRQGELWALRKGPWKVHLKTGPRYGKNIQIETHNPPLLFNLLTDPSERSDVAAQHPDVVRDLLEEIERHKKGVEPGPDQK